MNSIKAFIGANQNLLFSLLYALLIFFLFWIASAVITRKVIPTLIRKFDEDSHPIVNQLLAGFRRPTGIYLKLAGICLSLLWVTQRIKASELPRSFLSIYLWLPDFLSHCLRIGMVLCITWGLVASSSITQLLLRNARHRLDLKISKSVFHFLSAIFNVVVVAIAVVIILSELNYDINGLIAGLGLGGLTIALAAKDSAANFFGGLVLVIEKPFEIGDWIACNDVEGTVEDISLRSTKVRTSPGSLTIVPNATLAGAPITNWSSGMEKRRTDFTLRFTYHSTKQQLRSFTAAVKTLLETDPDIATDTIVTHFTDFNESGLVIRVIYYTTLAGFKDSLRIKERVNYSIMDLAGKHGLVFAYPTSTVYLADQSTAMAEEN